MLHGLTVPLRVCVVQVGPKEPLRVRGRSVGRRGESLKLHVEVTAVGHTRVLSFRCDYPVHSMGAGERRV